MGRVRAKNKSLGVGWGWGFLSGSPLLSSAGASPSPPRSPGDRSPVCDSCPLPIPGKWEGALELQCRPEKRVQPVWNPWLGRLSLSLSLSVSGSHVNCPPGNEGAVQLGLHVVLERLGWRQHETFLCLLLLFLLVLLILAIWLQGTRGGWCPEDRAPVPKHLSFWIVGSSSIVASSSSSSSRALPPPPHPQQDEGQGPPARSSSTSSVPPTAPHTTGPTSRGEARGVSEEREGGARDRKGDKRSRGHIWGTGHRTRQGQ